MEHNKNICKLKSVPADAMSQIVAPFAASKRITISTHDHVAAARAEEF
ncbi:hypothetical protein thalar_01995 [Litoreibacter arenae DSM 19593]|uniref:Uncharacterized protein n=1 Tax=Litoreibacter arenae DSM 19593 TaxID=1123360 RepID=S9QH60_9RHOB|nr:hypothetical protein thalar_01995 [Litoreibacter arenae DSM 19593]